VSTIFLVLAQALPVPQVLPVLRVLPFPVLAQVLQALQLLQLLPSPVLEVSIGCSQST